MTENGAVKGDTISTTSSKAASWPRVLRRTVMGVRDPMAVVGSPFKIGATRRRVH